MTHGLVKIFLAHGHTRGFKPIPKRHFLLFFSTFHPLAFLGFSSSADPIITLLQRWSLHIETIRLLRSRSSLFLCYQGSRLVSANKFLVADGLDMLLSSSLKLSSFLLAFFIQLLPSILPSFNCAFEWRERIASGDIPTFEVSWQPYINIGGSWEAKLEPDFELYHPQLSVSKIQKRSVFSEQPWPPWLSLTPGLYCGTWNLKIIYRSNLPRSLLQSLGFCGNKRKCRNGVRIGEKWKEYIYLRSGERSWR